MREIYTPGARFGVGDAARVGDGGGLEVAATVGAAVTVAGVVLPPPPEGTDKSTVG